MEHASTPGVLLGSPCACSDVDGVVEFGVCDVQFVRIDANDRDVLLVHTSNFEGELASKNDIVVEFMPKRKCCEFRSGETVERVEIETIDY